MKLTYLLLTLVLSTCYMAPAIADPIDPSVFKPYVAKSPEGSGLYRESKDTLVVSGGYVPKLTEYISLEWYKNPFTTLRTRGSDGGYLSESFSLSNFNNAKGITFHVPHEAVCLSACAFTTIWTESSIIEGTLGFHSAYRGSTHISENSWDVRHGYLLKDTEINRRILEAGLPYFFIEIMAIETNPSLFMIVYDDDLEYFKSFATLAVQPADVLRHYWLKDGQTIKGED